MQTCAKDKGDIGIVSLYVYKSVKFIFFANMQVNLAIFHSEQLKVSGSVVKVE